MNAIWQWGCTLVLMTSTTFAAGAETPAGTAKRRPLVVAHRGLLRHAPENTLSNFRACMELRLGFELDVRRTKDGKLVCLHDETVDRTTNGTGRVGDFALAELQRLDAGSWFDPAFSSERVPTVDETFALLARHRAKAMLVAVDLKGADARIEGDVVRLAQEHQVLGRLLFIGRAIGSPGVRRRLKKSDPGTQVAGLANRPEDFDAALADEHADWIYVRYVPSLEQVQRGHHAGKRLFIAGPTVSGPERANWRAAAEIGIDAILTDYPLELKRLLNSTQSLGTTPSRRR